VSGDQAIFLPQWSRGIAFPLSLEFLTAPPCDGEQPWQGLFWDPVATNLLVEPKHRLLGGVFGAMLIANLQQAESKND
jgi:hypothetical protein